jgi:hypothetical protein
VWTDVAAGLSRQTTGPAPAAPSFAGPILDILDILDDHDLHG